jgi:hypothetical protein
LFRRDWMLYLSALHRRKWMFYLSGCLPGCYADRMDALSPGVHTCCIEENVCFISRHAYLLLRGWIIYLSACLPVVQKRTDALSLGMRDSSRIWRPFHNFSLS